jgi:hypothetical protein
MTNNSYSYAKGLKMYYEIHGTGKPLILIHAEPAQQECLTMYCFLYFQNIGR